MGLLTVFLMPVAALATALVVIRSDREIIIAADSLQTFQDRSRRGSLEACKIIRTPNGVVAFSGTVGGTGFNPTAIAVDALNQAGTLSQRAHRFSNNVQPSMTQFLRSLRDESTRRFEDAFQVPPVMEVVFATFEREVPSLAVRAFRVNPRAVDPFRIQLTSLNCTATSNDCRPLEVLALGRQDAMASVASRLPDRPPNLVSAARQMIEAQIVATPQDVGPPIDVIKISADGMQWISRKTSCSE